MVKTFNDLIVAYESFQFSEDFYDMMKEAAELDLMDKFLDNQEFMATESYTLASAVTDDYFQEAVNGETIKNVAHNAKEKTANLMKRFCTRAREICAKIIKFFKTVANRIRKFAARKAALVKFAANLNYSTIFGMLMGEGATKAKTFINMLKDSQMSTKPHPFEDTSEFNQDHTDAISKLIRSKYVRMYNFDEAIRGIMNPDEIADLIELIAKNPGKARAKIAKITDPNTKYNSIRVIIDPEEIDRQCDKLDGIMSDISEMVSDEGVADGNTGNLTPNSDKIAALNGLYKIAANTISFYSKFMKIYTAAIEFIEYINKSADEKRASAKADKAKKKAEKAAPKKTEEE